ncbi:MAG TPA: GNAT family protein [Actinomycetota bacterium]|nr:GNAT family protein [Actinomycetota bacterium]
MAVLRGDRVVLRPGEPDDVPRLRAILAEASVMLWWGEPDDEEDLAEALAGDGECVMLVIEAGGAVAGGIQYCEQPVEQYRHAGIDIFLSTAHQGRGLGTEAVGLLVRFLIDQRHHHRLTIDPAAANARAIRSYEKVGFRPVGILREYERGLDGTFHDGLLMDLLASETAR